MKKSLLLLATGLLLSTQVMALDNVQISGYATAAGGYITDNTVGSTTFVPVPGHDGYVEEKIEFQPDSVAGIQISSRVADDVTVTVQLVSQFDNQAGAVELDWAYINYELNDDFTLQAGRFVPQIFLYSSTVNVGYTYLWIAPPSELYDQAPMRYTDGVNLMLDHTFSNDVTIEGSVYASYVSQDINFAGQLFPSKFENFVSASGSISNEYFKLRASYVQTDMSSTLNGVNEAAPYFTAQSDPNGDGLDGIEGIKADEVFGKFTTIGFTMDAADIIVIAEYGLRNIQDSIFTEDTTSYYATLAYRLGNFTPHVTYSVLETDFLESDEVVLAPDSSGTLVPVGTVGALRSSLSTDSKTVTAGLRYELNSRTALKFEYQNTKKAPQEIDEGLFTSKEESEAQLYKAALTVIF